MNTTKSTNEDTANTTTANNAPHGRLLRYSDASYIRPATACELRDSIRAGAKGVIEVTIDGAQVACYVEG